MASGKTKNQNVPVDDSSALPDTTYTEASKLVDTRNPIIKIADKVVNHFSNQETSGFVYFHSFSGSAGTSTPRINNGSSVQKDYLWNNDNVEDLWKNGFRSLLYVADNIGLGYDVNTGDEARRQANTPIRDGMIKWAQLEKFARVTDADNGLAMKSIAPHLSTMFMQHILGSLEDVVENYESRPSAGESELFKDFRMIQQLLTTLFISAGDKIGFLPKYPGNPYSGGMGIAIEYAYRGLSGNGRQAGPALDPVFQRFRAASNGGFIRMPTDVSKQIGSLDRTVCSSQQEDGYSDGTCNNGPFFEPVHETAKSPGDTFYDPGMWDVVARKDDRIWYMDKDDLGNETIPVDWIEWADNQRAQLFSWWSKRLLNMLPDFFIYIGDFPPEEDENSIFRQSLDKPYVKSLENQFEKLIGEDLARELKEFLEVNQYNSLWGIESEGGYEFWTTISNLILGATTSVAEADRIIAESKDLAFFDFDACGITPVPEPDYSGCPGCVPNPKATVPRWTGRNYTNPFLNEQTCEYWLTLGTLSKDMSNLTTDLMDGRVKGLEMMLRALGKDDSEATVNSILEIPNAVNTPNSFLDTRPGTYLKILVTVAFDAIETAPDKGKTRIDEMLEEAASAPQEPPTEVTLYAADLDLMPKVIKKAFRKYAAQYQQAGFAGTIPPPDQQILLIREGQHILEFKRKLIKFLRRNDFKINASREIPLLEAVRLTFADDFSRVLKVEANILGCDGEEFNDDNPGKFWDEFTKSDVARNTQTLAFFSQLTNIYDDVTARKPITVDNFLKKYWFPPLNFSPGQSLELLNDVDTSKACNWKNFKPTAPFVHLGADIAGVLLSFPDLWLNSVVKNTCKTLEGKIIEDKKYNNKEMIQKRIKDADLRKYIAGDGMFAKFIKDMEGGSDDKEDKITNLNQLYNEIIDKFGWCGFMALLQGAMGCIMKGLDLDLSLKTLLETFINNANGEELEGLFFKLNPGLQAALKEIAKEFSNGAALPWEQGYHAGSYTGPGNKSDIQYYGKKSFGTGSVESRIKNQNEFIEEEYEKFKEDHPDPEAGSFDVSTKTGEGKKFEGQLKNIKTNTKNPGHGLNRVEVNSGGTYGSLADTVSDKLIYEPLVKAFLKAIKENIISPDVFMEALNGMPGGALIMNFITGLQECPPPSFFHPPLDDFLKTAELDFCKGHFSITLPKLKKQSIGKKDLKKIIVEAAEQAMEQMLMRLVMMIISKIMNWMVNMPCELLADAAGITKSLLGGSNIKKALTDQLCDDATEEDLAEAIADLCNDWNVWDPNCDCTPTQDDVSNFMTGISAILTSEESFALLKGEANSQTLSYVGDVIQGSSECIKKAIPNPQSAQAMFTAIGEVISLPEVEKVLESAIVPGLPLCPSICDVGTQGVFNSVREAALGRKGLTKEQLQDQIDLLNDLARKDLEDLSNMVQGGLFDSIPDFQSDDPACPENGLLPYVDESTLEQGAAVTKGVFDTITGAFTGELITRKGLLNMILADTKGAGLNKHTNWYVNVFGESKTSEWPAGPKWAIFKWFADVDDAEKDAGHLFPETVGKHFQTKLTEASYDFNADSFNFSTPTDNLFMTYYNWEDPQEVKIIYNNYLVAPEGGLIGKNTFSVRLESDGDSIEPFSIIGERSLDSGTLDYIDMYAPYAPEYDTLQTAIVADIFNFRQYRKGTVPTMEYVPSTFLPRGENFKQSLQSTIFAQMVKNKWSQHGEAAAIGHFDSSGGPDYFSNEMFNYMTNAILKKFSLKISQNARTFDFGFDKTLNPTIHYLTDYEAYGGNAKNPPFWIEPPAYGGWLGLYDAMVPEVDACKEEPLINFKNLATVVDDYNKKFKNDERLDAPNPFCVAEPVYSRILTGAGAAGIEGMIRATVRLYIVEAMIKGMPVFSLFETKYPNMFDETLFSYLAQKIRDGLIETGRNIFGRIDLTKDTYYYIFLEQVVQSFDRKVVLEEITPTQSELRAMARIRQARSTWIEPEACSKHYLGARRACRKQRRDQFVEFMIDTQYEALVILNRYIAQELEIVGELFKSNIKPTVKDFPSLIFGSPQWMVAGAITTGGPLDVASNVFSSVDITSTVHKIIGDPDHSGADLTTQEASEEEGYFPFVLEKYIRIEDYAEGETPPGNLYRDDRISEKDILGEDYPRAANLYEIVNMDDWSEFLDNHEWTGPKGEGLVIGNIYKKWSFGLRISFKMPRDFTNKLPGSPEIYFSDEQREKQKSLRLVNDADGSSTYVLPFIISEVEINNEQAISQFDISQFDLGCLVAQMIESQEYKVLFNYCFPLPGLLSLVTIYTMESFLMSIGAEWGTTQNGKQGGGDFSQFKHWDQWDLFKKTKRLLRKAFQAFYYSSDDEYVDPDKKSSEERNREKLRIKRKVPKDADIKRWQRRLQRPKPEEECKK